MSINVWSLHWPKILQIQVHAGTREKQVEQAVANDIHYLLQCIHKTLSKFTVSYVCTHRK